MRQVTRGPSANPGMQHGPVHSLEAWMGKARCMSLKSSIGLCIHRGGCGDQRKAVIEMWWERSVCVTWTEHTPHADHGCSSGRRGDRGQIGEAFTREGLGDLLT